MNNPDMGYNGYDGQGAHLNEKGVYTIASKAILGNKKLIDKFEYEIK
jgi:hypothetical protein